MPSFVQPMQDNYARRFVDFERRIRALEHAQQATWSDSQFRKIAGMGVQNDDQTVGLWFHDPTTGNPVLKVGQLKEGSNTYYGLAVYDQSGNLMAQVGQLSDGTYGASHVNSSGAQVDLGTMVSPTVAEVVTAQSTTSLSFTDLATVGPELTCYIGPSGRALVWLSAFVSPGTADNGGNVGLSIDGGSADLNYSIEYETSTAFIGSTVTGPQLITGLSTGNHTFKMQYSSTSGTVTFSNRYLLVQPF